jgi:hypothetical protein
MWWWKDRTRQERREQRWPLSMTLLSLSENDDFSLANACEGVFICGTTGSGKTTGSGELFATSYLNAGMGGLVLTAKADERRLWERYCRDTGRLGDLIVFSPSEKWRFNFLDHEARRAGPGGGLTENLVNLFTEVLQVAERQTGSGGREDEGYWRRAMRQMVRNCTDVLMLGPGKVSIPDLYRMVVSLPTSPSMVSDKDWQARSFAYQCLMAADRRPKSEAQRIDYGLCLDYCIQEFPALSDKTRSIIVSTFTSMVDVFQRSVLRELFCTTTNISPEAVEDGAIIVIDLPVKEFAEVGQLSQALMKYVFMRSIERRRPEANPRPVFLWVDESQLFTLQYDYLFQTTARSSRVATVYLTQNLSNYYATLGAGEEGRAVADSLLGNVVTKIFHANGDAVTNEWAANMIGRSRQFFVNASSTRQTDLASALFGVGGGQSTGGVSEVMEYEVSPQRFTTLRKGGRANSGLVDGIVFQGGRRFKATGRTWLPVTFEQRL